MYRRIKKKKRIILNILLLIITLVLSIIVFEIFLKLTYPEFGIKKIERYDNLPVLDLKLPYMKEMDNDDARPLNQARFVGENNNIILYHPDFSVEHCSQKKGENTFRIIFIGDSVTQGVKIDISRIFSKLLEEKLNNLSYDKKFEVLNFALAGYNLEQINYIFKNEALKCEPDIIIYGFYYNDINSYRVQTTEDNVIFSYSLDEIKYLYDFPWNKYLLRNSLAYRFFNVQSINLLENIGIQFPVKHYSLFYEDAEKLLKNMNQISNTLNIPLLIINFPTVRDHKEYEINNFLYMMNKTNSIDYFEIKDKFIEHNIDPSKLTLDNDHYNEYGHKIVANILFDYIKTLEIIKKLGI